jgi:crotonobetainyl-CoA:carnitine CoA-transferase CaiB-like acyl-CoA transferase
VNEYSSREADNLPLSGIRILDLTRALSGPFCTALLGDLGADVVKVETPNGELCRKWGPWQESTSLYFLSANRNKRSIALDMWSDAGREVLRRLARDADVLVENFRPGVLAALGLGEDWTSRNCPDLMVASISGFGHIGPRSGEACFDQVALGLGGLMSVTGTEESGPMRSGIPLADTLAGMFAALGICASLVSRRPGRKVNTSLLESVIGVLGFQGQRYLSLGEIPRRQGNDHPVVVPYGVFRTSDRPINVAAGAEGQFSALCSVLAVPELVEDARFSTPRARKLNKDALNAELEARFIRRSADYWLPRLSDVHVPCGPINTLDETFADPQVEALGVSQVVTHPHLGEVRMARGPIWVDGVATAIERAAPLLGQHTIEILRDHGYSERVIDVLHADGVVRSAPAQDR